MKSIRARPAGRALGRVLGLPAAAAALMSGAAPARAHAFGVRYDLPLPLDLYITGAGGAVVLSFVVIALARRVRPAGQGEAAADLLALPPVRALLHPALGAVLRVLSVALFGLVVAAGLFGTQDTARNVAPTFVWIVWWVGLAYVAALVGNPWPALNPWSALFAWAEGAVRRLAPRARGGPPLAYPARLGAWPAVVLFVLFAWLELVSDAARAPAGLAEAVLGYSVITWAGMALFGRRAWLAHGEAFSLAFGVFGRFAPLGVPQGDGSSDGPRRWPLRPYAADLAVTEPCPPSLTVFVLAMLATVAFDGFRETPAWGALLGWIARAGPLGALVRRLHYLGFDYQRVVESAVLALFPLLFAAVFLAFCELGRRAAGSRRSAIEVAGLFVFSLVPIAIAYHLAHYLSYLLIAGQLAIPLASDPFGLGWDLFGTAGYRTDIGVIGAGTVWTVAVLAIVGGHVIAVAVAHRVALAAFGSRAAALRSQIPFLVLMVAYTMLSLWILAQPIVAGQRLGRLAATADTLTLAPYEFREYCTDLGRGDTVRYAFQARHPVEFNIHFHEGLAIRYPVRGTLGAVAGAAFTAGRRNQYCLMWFNRGLAETTLTYSIALP